MDVPKALMTRRDVLAATALVSSFPRNAIAQSTGPNRNPASASMIRPATPQDVSAMVALLTQDAVERSDLDPLLWRMGADTPNRIEQAVRAALSGPGPRARELWFIAEHAGRIVGVTHAMLVPVPPIYDAAAGAPGLLLDDCFILPDAPSGTAEALIANTEAALTRAGAARLIVSCPAAGRLRPLYESRGYQPVTLYMAKHRLRDQAVSPAVRNAGLPDVPGIVKRSAEHRRTLARINPRFWHIHPDADNRFEAWMQRSLAFKDRDMLVATAGVDVRGYAIAQPIAPLLVPVAHEITAIGIIDDFYDEDFADTSALSADASRSAGLLTAAESAFVRRTVDTALVVCPAEWPSKISLLKQGGYQPAKLWMVRS